MYSCISCPLAPQQLAGWICKLVAAEYDWSINRWNLMLIKVNAFNIAWQWFAWVFMLPKDLLLGIPWFRLYLLQKQHKWRGPVVSEGWLFFCLWVSLTFFFLYQMLFQGSCENVKCNDIWKQSIAAQIHCVHRNIYLWRSIQILFFQEKPCFSR